MPQGRPEDARTSRDAIVLHVLRQLAIDPEEEIPEDFYSRVMTQADRQSVPHRPWWAWVRLRAPVWGLPALATCLILSLALNIWQGFQGERAVEGLRNVPRPSTLYTAIATGQHLRQDKQYPSALREYQSALQEVLQQLMVLAAQAQRDEQTIEAATALLLLLPNNGPSYRYRGLAYARTGNRGQALQDMRRAADLGDSDAQRVLQTWKEALP